MGLLDASKPDVSAVPKKRRINPRRSLVPTKFMSMENKQDLLNRRAFLRRTTLAAAAASLPFPYVGRVLGANDRINVACIGVGGKGESDSSHAFQAGGNIVAICDVDGNTLNAR